MNNIFKDQAYRLLLASIKKEVTEELKELQGDIIHLKDASERLRKFQYLLGERVDGYFNHKSETTQEKIRKIKTPYNSYKSTYFPRVTEFDRIFEDYFSLEYLKERHEKRIEHLSMLVKEYYKNEYFKDEKHNLKEWTTDSRTLTIPLHSVDVFRFNAICSQTVYENLAITGDASDYVISCMYGELARIDTWQYRSNRFLINEIEKVSLCESMMRTDYIEHNSSYRGFFDDYEMSLNYPKNKHYSYGSLLSLEVDTNYKIPRLIGIALKKAAAENLETVDNILGIKK